MMVVRVWLWIGTGLDLILLVAAIYMAISAVDIVGRSDRSPMAIGIAGVFLVFPVLCIAALIAAWQAYNRRRSSRRVVTLFAAPWMYAGFLAVFLNYS
jgi:hypothetical protein